MARPKIKIIKEIFENACGIQCTLEEIASVFGCSEDTIRRWTKEEYGERFATIYKKYSAKGKMSLRRMQWKLAEKSPAMAIFLGKNMLGQSDRPTPAGFDPRAWGQPVEGATINGYSGTETEGTDD